MTSFAKSREKDWASHHIPLSMWGWAGKANWAERGKTEGIRYRWFILILLIIRNLVSNKKGVKSTV